MDPRVSVLMPTYDQASFLPRAVESLKMQTLSAWELIVVDDGSPDSTHAALAPYRDDPRVSYYRFPRNEGLGRALNRALDAARAAHRVSAFRRRDVPPPPRVSRRRARRGP